MSSPDSTPAPRRLRLNSGRDPDGEVRATFLIRDGETLALWDETADGEAPALALPAAALLAVFQRYAKPLDENLVLEDRLVRDDEDDEPLAIPLPAGSASLRRFRFKPYGWVHPADYLLWEQPGCEPIAAPAPLIASALSAIARAAAR